MRFGRLGASVMLVVAALASIATSPPYVEIAQQSGGETFLLSAGTPLVSIPFEFEVSDVVRQEADLFMSFDLGVVWREVGADARMLRFSISDAAGSEIESGTFGAGTHIGCHRKCLGGGELVVEWPAAGAGGTAVVDWSYDMSGGFGDDSPPEGATIDFEVTGPGAPSGTTTVVSAGLADQPLARQRLTLSPGDGRLWFEVPGTYGHLEPGTSMYLVLDGEKIQVEPSDAVPLEPPPGCDSACSWHIDLVRIDGTHDVDRGYRSLAWRIVEVGATVSATASVTDVEPPTIGAEVSGGPEVLEGDATVNRRIRLTVPAVAVPASEFGESDPWVDLRLTVELVGDASLDRGDLFMSLNGLGPPGSGSELVRRRWGENYSSGIQGRTRLECDLAECTADFTVVLGSAELRSRIPVEWTVEASLSYPFADTPPGDAEMILEVRR